MKENGNSLSPMSCPYNRGRLNGMSDSSFSCFYSGEPDSSGEVWKYESCSFNGSDYRSCSRYKLKKVIRDLEKA